ncbi:MAG: hypothetical protein BTN85_0726 [Candidatus Methanohalarchaeum thermophilum]|uniref:Uncharacterized protein n=1 Tax=Methanohalarchaeum thermophilum TaxID=1903181 RepID=A0A1Q6DV41_METT1|nr:MAG: hypothetical protein BTN85_0726 [Candidatus Methanohalarchaeum thermophilum]
MKKKIDLDYIEENFPKIYEEIKESEDLEIDEVVGREKEQPKKQDNIEKEREKSKKETKMPTVIDHLKGCKNDDEAIEIINFFKKQKEIPNTYAENLIEKIDKEGVRTFGEKREKGKLEKEGL